VRLAVISEPGVVEIGRTPDHKVSPGHLLIQTHVSGISSGTELMVLDGRLPNIARGFVRYPLVPGYENVGQVLSVGAGATGFEEGDWVCSEGTPNFPGLQSCWGGHCEQVMAPAKEVFPLPKQISPEHGIFMVLTAVALHGVQRARIGVGDTVVVFGAGVVGLLAAQIARVAGADRVITVDRLASRIELAKELGADDALLVQPEGSQALAEVCREVMQMTQNRGADVVIEATGSPNVASAAVTACRERGRFLLLGMYPQPVTFDCWDLYSRELDIHSSRGAGPKEDIPRAGDRWSWRRTYEHALLLLASGRVCVNRLITHRLPAESIAEGYRLLRTEPEHALKVVLEWR
jgi:2-desacetyl-2-hydroxyethyl bacteriochlorophyllide A dehydrogenase